jgi:hypothetical protein
MRGFAEDFFSSLTFLTAAFSSSLAALQAAFRFCFNSSLKPERLAVLDCY